MIKIVPNPISRAYVQIVLCVYVLFVGIFVVLDLQGTSHNTLPFSYHLGRNSQFQTCGAFPGSRRWLVLFTHVAICLPNYSDSNILIPLEATVYFKGQVFAPVPEKLSSVFGCAVCCVCCPQRNHLCVILHVVLLYVLRHYRGVIESVLKLMEFKCF